MIALGGAYSHVFLSMLILGVLGTFFSLPLARGMHSVNVKFNSSYAVLIPVEGTPLSFMKNNVAVPQGSPSNHCRAGLSCWELLDNGLYAQLHSDKVHGNGAIIVTPRDSKKSSTEILVRDRNGTSKGLPTQVLEVDPKTNSYTVLLYDEEVQKTTVSGNIQMREENGQPSGKSSSMVLYLSPVFKGKNAVLLTGYFGTSNELFQVKLADNRNTQVIVIGDSNVPDYKALRVSFHSACAVNTWKVTVYVLSLIVIKVSA